MGSIGANRNSANGQSPQDFVNNLANDITRNVAVDASPEELINNGDIQGIVEAYAMTHPNVDEEELLKSVREAVEAKINPSKKSTEIDAKGKNGDKVASLLFNAIQKGGNANIVNIGKAKLKTASDYAAMQIFINRDRMLSMKERGNANSEAYTDSMKRLRVWEKVQKKLDSM